MSVKRFPRAIALALALVIFSPAAAAFAYDGSAAARYADQYWSSYNKSYPSFANKGGDCTNFVSQALFAGGIQQRPSPLFSGTAAWYMTQQNGKNWSWSTSWINSQDNSLFLSTLGGTVVQTVVGATANTVVPSNAQQGDVVLYDWTNDGVFDHEAIIATADGQYVDAHTNNRYHEYWTLAQFNTYAKTTRIVVVHIPASAS